MNYGLRREEVKEILKQKLNQNPDLFYYIDIDYIEELVDLLSEGIAEAIEKNNKRFIDDMNRELRRKF